MRSSDRKQRGPLASLAPRWRALAALLLLGQWSCKSEDARTIVDVKVELKHKPAEDLITILRTNVKEGNRSAAREFSLSGGAPLKFPVSFGIELGDDVIGPIEISVEGVDAMRRVLATGSIPMQKITRGKVTLASLWLLCPGACPPDAGAAREDAGADAAEAEVGGNCGNGQIDRDETCDTAIPRGKSGACPPASCDDMLACTKDAHHGSGCTATCTHEPVTETVPNDGCCPARATHLTDPDCSANCGNGMLEPGEYCDTGVPAGAPTSCPLPAECPDSNGCTRDLYLSAGTCNAICAHSEITTFVGGDLCCPTGATHTTDADCPVVCGNGVHEKPTEACDTNIPAGKDGACPTVCPPRAGCFKELVEGSGCQAACRPVPINEFVGGDNCCPMGGNRALDPDCAAVCGNGVFEPGEICDTAVPAGGLGACPTACAPDPGGCMPRSLTGKDCTIHCVPNPITSCSATTDGCCPSGCSSANDPDCSSTCGNGVVEINETCDLAIPQGMKGSCPRQCDDSNSCTTEMLLSKDTCNARCMVTPINMFAPDDGCCPPGGNHNLDSDCPAVCGNGAVEGPKETCDPAIAAGSTGACPKICSAPADCRKFELVGDGTMCTARCQPVTIKGCASGDSCCPPGCNHDTDADCPAVCGNAIVDSGEACDRGITAGMMGACPASCDDAESCTTDSTSGSVLDCTRTCSHAAITACASGDRCCPDGCSPTTDSDCLPVCGNGLVEDGETCDPASSCPTTCPDEGDACTQDKLVGLANECKAVCQHLPITTCSGSVPDGCCPTPLCSSRPDSTKFDTDCAGTMAPSPGP